MFGPEAVHDILRRHQLVDGYPMVLDLERSEGVWMHDAVTGKRYLDVSTHFASWPMGYRHPMLQEAGFQTELARAATTKVANADNYTMEMARFVDAFATRATPPGFPHHFWIAGGALGVENALKAAFDWKARKLGRTSFEDDVNDLVVLHLRRAFHGRSGYTLSVTNTLPDKIGLFPKFDWPRVHNPAIVFDLEGGIANDIEAEEARATAEVEEVFRRYGDKVAAILAEPLQGEGGDNHFRPEFLAMLRRFADEREALLVYDEVQTGFWSTGVPWLWQRMGVAPDIVAFGKKSQVCGFYCSERIDEVPDNVFQRSSRINSTWGGDLADMVRCRRLIEIIEADDLGAHITAMGERLVGGLRRMAADTGAFTNPRGVGSMVAITLGSTEERGAVLGRMFGNELLALPSGQISIRFRLPYVIAAGEIDDILSRLEASLA
jgi:L-lysine 6-transaminase